MDEYTDQNMLDALAEIDTIQTPSVDAFTLVAAKHKVDADDLFEAWCEC